MVDPCIGQAAALESLARDHRDNQWLLYKAGAIEPLVALFSSTSKQTQVHLLFGYTQRRMCPVLTRATYTMRLPWCHLKQVHALGALLFIGSHDEDARNATIKRLVAVLDMRNAAAQMKAAEALANLAARSAENRRAITAAQAVAPLV